MIAAHGLLAQHLSQITPYPLGPAIDALTSHRG
jgi:hypothetical protein